MTRELQGVLTVGQGDCMKRRLTNALKDKIMAHLPGELTAGAGRVVGL